MLRTLTRKVTLAALVFLILIVAAAAFVLTNIVGLARDTTHLADETTARIELIGDFNTNLTQVALEAASYARSQREKDLDEGQEALAAAASNLAGLKELLERPEHAGTSAEHDYAPLEERQQALLASVQQHFDEIVRSVAVNDDLAVDRALNELDALEDDAERLEADVDTVLEQDIAQSAGAVTTSTRLAIASVSGLVGLVVLLLLLAMVLLQRQIVLPTRRLAQAVDAITAGERQHLVRVTSNDEIGDLQRAFNTMATTIQQQTASLEQEVAAAQAARAEAEVAQAGLAEQLETVETQRVVIREMSVPILPLTPTTMVMPLIGELDNERLQLVQEQALQALDGSHARCLIFDTTGVPIIDSSVAERLLQVVQAARLLGTEVVWVGIRPEVAQALVGLGIDLARVVTRSTLQSGVAYALARH
jgi:rsbT co-antagonist protein RsbR